MANVSEEEANLREFFILFFFFLSHTVYPLFYHWNWKISLVCLINSVTLPIYLAHVLLFFAFLTVTPCLPLWFQLDPSPFLPLFLSLLLFIFSLILFQLLVRITVGGWSKSYPFMFLYLSISYFLLLECLFLGIHPIKIHVVN